MKTKKITALSLIAAGCGGIALGLRQMLYATGLDGRDLLLRNHPLDLACWGMTAVLALVLLLALRKTEWSGEYADAFPASLPGAVGTIAAMGGSISLAFQAMEAISDKMTLLWTILAFAAAVCFAVTAGYRLRGKQPTIVFHGIICLFFCIHMICQYRTWSSNPQVADYEFALLACVMLALTALQRVIFDAGLGKPRSFLFTSVMAVFFCFASLIGPEYKVFYLYGGVWAFANLLPPPRREAKPEEV